MTAKRAVTIYKSLSNCIFENLAFEDWVFSNLNGPAQVLFVWRNEPCVVIGRHQNPWLEVDIGEARRRGTPVARRRSGGGTVYHDMGNINFTFFGPRSDYNRKRNISLVTSAIQKQWGIPLEVNCRDDILYQGQKVSGSAAKLTRTTSLHHFSLLVRTDLGQLKHLLHRNSKLCLSNHSATPSVKSSVTNLGTTILGMDLDSVCATVAKETWRDNAVPLPNQKIELVNPGSDGRFDGVEQMKAELKKWEWVYGKTPPFTVNESVAIGDGSSVAVQLHIRQGVVSECSLQGDGELELNLVQGLLEGTRFWPDDIAQKKMAASKRLRDHPTIRTLLKQIEQLP